MSRLIDGLKKLSQAAPAPMGFLTSRKVEIPPSILIIAVVQVSGAGAAVKGVTGADAVLLRTDETGTTVSALQKAVKSLKDMPWGAYPGDNGDAAGLVEAGCDFLVFTPASRIAAIPDDEKIGRVLAVESAMDDGLLRAINDLPADAVLLTDTFSESNSLVWHQMMIYRHLKAFISKPILVPAPATIIEAELKALWEAGIDGVAVDITAGSDLKSLREMVAKLPPRSARKRNVILPRSGKGIYNPEPDEEEEEEDEDE
jgi:hypothetical protein